jgi:hypothetical protein
MRAKIHFGMQGNLSKAANVGVQGRAACGASPWNEMLDTNATQQNIRIAAMVENCDNKNAILFKAIDNRVGKTAHENATATAFNFAESQRCAKRRLYSRIKRASKLKS